MIKRLLIAAFLVAILMIGALFIAPGLIPTDTYREKLEAVLSQNLGRDVEILGDVKLSTFPAVQIQTGPVSLSNPKGFSENNFADIGAMTAKVKLWPLFSKQVEISGIGLDTPIIRLEKRRDGAVNWSIDNGSEITPKSDESGPFKRDGRYTEHDLSLALLQINNGKVTYSDVVASRNLTVEVAELNLRAPSLNDSLTLESNFKIDGLNTELNATVASPSKFLSGQETPFEFQIDTQEGDINISGAFKAGEEIAFDANFKGRSATPLALAKRLPLSSDLSLPPIEQIDARGNMSYYPDKTHFPKIVFAAEGQGFNVTFDGNMTQADRLSARGAFSVLLADMSILEAYMEAPILALSAVSGVEANGNLELEGGNRVKLQNLTTQLSGPHLEAKFEGQATWNDELILTGIVAGGSTDFANLITSAGLSIPDSVALGTVKTNGNLNYTGNRTVLSEMTASAEDGLANGDFTGKIIYTDRLDLTGNFSGEIPDLGVLDSALPRDIPYSDIARRITLSGEIGTSPDGYILNNLEAALTEGLMNGDFSGRLSVGDSSDISGNLKLRSDSMRAIALTQSIKMPPSTDVGPIFEAFQISGDVSGTPDRIKFDNGVLSLDNLSSVGNFSLNMIGDKPVLRGQLSLDPLDLRPYTASWSEQKPEGIILPWSTVPINLSGINSMEAEVDILAPSVKMDRLEFGKTRARSYLENGVLTTNINNAELYEGLVDGSVSISATNGVPTLSVQADIASVAAQTFFDASSGFDKVAGTANLSLSFEGQGLTQEDIMKSLSGTGSFNILNGQLFGINAEELLSGIDEALASKKIPDGLGLGKVTNFNDLIGAFSISKGRVKVGNFNLKSGDLFMDADGLIDLGRQKLDFGLQPKLSEGSDLAKFGIPLQFSGGFGQAKAGLDLEMLGEIAKAKARQKAGDSVRDRVGGPLGDILGGVIGGDGNTPSAPIETPPANPENKPQSESEPLAEETGQPDDPVTTPAPAEKPIDELPAPEEQIENALKNIFGRKKETTETE